MPQGSGRLEKHSFRIEVSVRLAARLYDATIDRSKFVPKVGVAGRAEGKPLLRVEGTPGSDDFKRIWKVRPDASSLSPKAATQALNDVAAQATSGGVKQVASQATPSSVVQAMGTSVLPIDDYTSARGPAILGDPGDNAILFTNVLARKTKLRFNAHRVADEAEIELPIEAFPFPPDGSLVRAVLVEIRRGVVSADDWAIAMTGARRARDGKPFTANLISESDEPDFVGFAEMHKLKIGSGASTVTFPCKDFAALLGAQQMHGRVINSSVAVDEAIARLLSTLPAMADLEVVWLGPEVPPGIGEWAPKAKRTKKGGTRPVSQHDQNQSYLDAIADYCTLCGVIPTFRGYRLYLGATRTLDQLQARGVPRMVLGENVEEFDMEHKMAGARMKSIEVRSFNPDTGKIVAARWPRSPEHHGEFAPGELNEKPPTGIPFLPPGMESMDEKSVEIMTVENVTNPQRCEDIARNAWEETARQDVSGKIVSKDVATIDGRAKGVADLLSMRAGDNIALVIAPSVEKNLGSYLQRLASLSRDQAAQVLVKEGWKPDVASRVAELIVLARRPLVYRIKDLEFDHAMDSVTKVELHFINLIEVIDREFETKSTGNLAKLGPNASFKDKWNAIEQDFYGGAISAEQASKLQLDAALANAEFL